MAIERRLVRLVLMTGLLVSGPGLAVAHHDYSPASGRGSASPPSSKPQPPPGFEPVEEERASLALAQAQAPYLPFFDRAARYDGYASAYFDGSEPHLLVTDQMSSADLSELLATLPDPEKVIVTTVRWTDAELNRAAQKIADRAPELADSGITLRAGIIDTRANKARILLTGDEDLARAVIAKIVDSSMIEIQQVRGDFARLASSRYDASPPFYAGG